MFPFKSPLLESLWSTTASFEPQAQKQKPKLGFLREGLALTQQGPRAAEERGIETPALPQRWNMYKSWICTPQMCHLVKYSRVCGHCPLKTTLCSLFESTALDPRVGCTGAGADFRHKEFSAQDISAAWVTRLFPLPKNPILPCGAIPRPKHPTGHRWPFIGSRSPRASPHQLLFQIPLHSQRQNGGI